MVRCSFSSIHAEPMSCFPSLPSLMPPEQRLVPQAALPEPTQSRLRSLAVSDNMIEGILLQLRILRFGFLQNGMSWGVIGSGQQ